MRRWVVVVGVAIVLVAAAVFAGAYLLVHTPGRLHSEERWTVWVNGTGPWRMGLPFPVSQPGTSFADWLDNLTATGDVTTRPLQTERGLVLEVSGTGDAVLRSYAVQFPMIGNRCCAEAFIDAAWTTSGSGSPAAVTEVSVWAPVGPFGIAIVYSADSAYCWRDADFRGSIVGNGWADLPGIDGTMCT